MILIRRFKWLHRHIVYIAYLFILPCASICLYCAQASDASVPSRAFCCSHQTQLIRSTTSSHLIHCTIYRIGTGTSVEGAFKGARPGTSRPVTASGRLFPCFSLSLCPIPRYSFYFMVSFVRLGTASIISQGGAFIDVERLDFDKYAQRPSLSKVLCDYLLYHDRNPRKALDLCAKATVAADYKDWWWKARMGKCYYQLGMFRDAEKQLKSALKTADMISVYLELCKVFFISLRLCVCARACVCDLFSNPVALYIAT